MDKKINCSLGKQSQHEMRSYETNTHSVGGGGGSFFQKNQAVQTSTRPFLSEFCLSG
jgi:hypothetical protein